MTVLSDVWSYLAIALIGFLPNEIWRVAGVVFSRRLDENSEIVAWMKAVATAMLAIIVVRLVLVPSAALVAVPLTIRGAAVGIGVAAFFIFQRSILAAVVTGQGAFLLGSWLPVR